MKTVCIEEVATVNPRPQNRILESLQRPVSFLAMSAVSENGNVIAEEKHPLVEVMRGHTYFERGDILLAKITPCMENGKAAYLEKLQNDIGFGSTEFHVLRPSPLVDGKYLFYAIWNPRFRFIAERRMTGSAGQKRVPAEFLKRYKIPLPPIAEQKRIAAILDKADAIQRKRQEANCLIEALTQAAFYQLIGDPILNDKGWQVVKLGTTFASSPQIGTITPATGEGRHPVIRVGEIGDTYVRLGDCGRVTLTGHDLDRFTVETDDLLLARAIGSEDHLGKASLFQGAPERVLFDSHVMRLRFDLRALHPAVFLAWLKSKGGRARFMRKAGRTAVQFNINARQIDEIDIPIPSQKAQLDFVRAHEAIASLQSNVTRAKGTDAELFASLIERAFRGEL